MENKPVKLITCRALDHILTPMLGPGVEKVVLEIGLHLSPERLRNRLLEEVSSIEEEGRDIIFGYGLCGRALEGVCSAKSRLVLPRVDDCVGALLGSRQRHKAVMARNPGCYFLEPTWIGSEVDIFYQCRQGLDRIPEHMRDKIVRIALKHYTQLALLEHGQGDSQEAGQVCRKLADEHGFEFIKYFSDLNLLSRLVNRDWNPDDFVIARPGEKIPYF